MQTKLGDIAQIQFGFYDVPVEHGDLAFLQARHFDEAGRLSRFDDSFLALSHQNQKHLLQPGDVLLAGKGFRLFAWSYEPTVGPAVASSLFFVLRPGESLTPGFLSTSLNLPATQAYFRQIGGGTNIPSIRKSELAECPVWLPPRAVQERVVRLQDLHEREINLTQALLKAKQTRHDAILARLLKS